MDEDGKPFKSVLCHLCPASFMLESYLRNHLKRVHKVIITSEEDEGKNCTNPYKTASTTAVVAEADQTE
jgi:hypothetical protein